LGATNVPWELDSAIRRRFEKRVYIPLPEVSARLVMLRLHLGDTPNNLTEEQFETVAEAADGASGADMNILVREALMVPLRTCQQAKQFMPLEKEGKSYLTPCLEYPSCHRCPPKLNSDKEGKDYTCNACGAKRMALWDVEGDQLLVPDIDMSCFLETLKHSHSSVGASELTKFTEWTSQFGEDGV